MCTIGFGIGTESTSLLHVDRKPGATRKFGIKKGMFLRKALQLCPQLKVLPYDYQGYEEVSLKVENILQSYASEYNANLEQVSCDESYMEFYLPMNTRDDIMVMIMTMTYNFLN